MPKVHSHYENLKVARDAAPDAIRAAYRSLTRQHHPDRNPGSADAERIMAMVNVAYGVLSDPARRLEHDRWIVQAEAPVARPVRSMHTLHSPKVEPAAPPSIDRDAVKLARQRQFDRRLRRAVAHVRRFRVGYGLAGTAMVAGLMAAGFMLREESMAGLMATTAPLAAISAPPSTAYARASVAPNGQPWPRQSGYVEGYAQASAGGVSELTIDNTKNDADMFVKLISLDGPNAAPARILFVSARSRFTVSALSIGTYDLRYRNLVTGALARSPAFIVEEVVTAQGTRHVGGMHMALYAGGDGALQTYALGERDF
jgi:curved DNA-binding protein CbpA